MVFGITEPLHQIVCLTLMLYKARFPILSQKAKEYAPQKANSLSKANHSIQNRQERPQ